MADISYLNIGGSDYTLKDPTARTNSENVQSMVAYKENGNTASQAYAVVGTPINWKGTLYTLKTPVAAGATWTVDTNLTLAPNLGKLTSNIKTYVNGDGNLVFRDLTGADTVLPFSGASTTLLWTNPNPTSNFAAQTLPSVPLADYDLIKVRYRISTSNATEGLSIFDCKTLLNTEAGNVTAPIYGIAMRIASQSVNDRRVARDNGYLNFGDSYANASYIRNECCIPLAIYGVKFVQ